MDVAPTSPDVPDRDRSGDRTWLDELPALLGAAVDRWGLVPGGRPVHGDHRGPGGGGGERVTWSVTRGSEDLVLAISRPSALLGQQVAAMRAWDGRGALLVHAADLDAGVVLLEPLPTGPSLAAPGVPVDAATATAGRLVRRLSIQAPEGVPRLTDIAQRVAERLVETDDRLGHPVPHHLLDAAADAARRRGPTAANLLVDADLHYAGVHSSGREPWLVVDPEPVAGDPEYGIARLLIDRFDEGGGRRGLGRRLAMLTACADLDPALAIDWGLVRTVDAWLRARDSERIYDVARCAEVAGWLLEVS